MNTIAPVKTRFKTLSAAQDHIENLERQIALNNAAASKAAAPVKAQTLTPPSAPPAVNQAPAAAAPPAAERPLAELSKRELTEVLDTANAQGDKKLVAKIWAEYSSR
jgi:hypothetical protein